ncbi:putative programmed cell death 6-interacting protein [Operophtera brumata]|uniref:Putative programmed cell death 6-interacting protein n=1 Tax=Operophtera brumata TaxID=104452 RepID=A0A0L7LD49_OPEBR|nr:putative programmed cell death 6-interacting protein [Operophtera brumata]
MAELLVIPFKKSSDVDLVKPLKNLIQSTYNSGENNEDFSDALNELSRLRTSAIWKVFEKSSLDVIYRSLLGPAGVAGEQGAAPGGAGALQVLLVTREGRAACVIVLLGPAGVAGEQGAAPGGAGALQVLLVTREGRAACVIVVRETMC